MAEAAFPAVPALSAAVPATPMLSYPTSNLVVPGLAENAAKLPLVTCAVCHEIYRDPVQCKNGHTFCRECLHQSLKQSPNCPVCRVYMTMADASRNLTAVHLIDTLMCFCPNRFPPNPASIPGTMKSYVPSHCGATMPFAELVAHLHSCPHGRVQCVCGAVMQLSDLRAHQDSCVAALREQLAATRQHAATMSRTAEIAKAMATGSAEEVARQKRLKSLRYWLVALLIVFSCMVVAGILMVALRLLVMPQWGLGILLPGIVALIITGGIYYFKFRDRLCCCDLDDV